MLRAVGGAISVFEREFRFSPPRRWRFDFAWPDHRVAVEIEGVTRDGSRHQRIAGFLKDAEKYEAAQLAGWTVYRVPSPWMKTRPWEVMNCIEQLVGWPPA